MGSDYSYCTASEHLASEGLDIVFLELSKIQMKKRAYGVWFPTLIPQDAWGMLKSFKS